MTTTSSQNPRLRPFKPTRFGRYTLLMPLSTGGMGEIFLGRLEGAQGFEKLCVIKKILPHLAKDPDFVERFVNEARILVKLSHGNVAQVLDMGVLDGAPYIALEFIDGKDLRRVIARMRERQMPLPLSFVLYATTRVLDALAYAHRKRGDDDRELNLVHRDVSPQNVLISYEGEVKVIDFGLAKSTLTQAQTNPSIVLGKFLYMAPEQARHRQADRRSDLYAVGLCLYELIAGKNPFDDVAPGEVMAKVANPEIAPLLQVEPLCPPALSDIVMKALAVDPAARFQSAEEFRARLQSVLLDVDPEAGPETASRFMREAFATEYQSERKLLAALREQARQLPAELPEEDEGLGTEDTDPSRSLSSRSVTHDALPVVAPLSFEPTRRQNVGRDEAESDGETRPAAVAPPAPARVAVKVRDQAPTEAATPVFVDEQNTPAPSIVVDEGLAQSPVAERRPEPPPGRPSKASLPRVASPEPRRAAPKGASARGLNEVKEKTGERAAVKRPRPAPPPEPKPAQTLQDEEPVAPPTRQDTKAAREPRPAGAKKGSMGVWLVLPVVALLAVGGYIAWDIYSEQLAPRPKPDEATPLPAPKERKSREVKVEPQEPAVKPDDDVAPLPKEPKKLPVVPVKRPVAPAAGSPAERAFARLKADQARIVDAHAAGRFVLRMQKLEDRLSASPNDPGLQKEIEALDAEVTALLDKP